MQPSRRSDMAPRYGPVRLISTSVARSMVFATLVPPTVYVSVPRNADVPTNAAVPTATPGGGATHVGAPNQVPPVLWYMLPTNVSPTVRVKNAVYQTGAPAVLYTKNVAKIELAFCARLTPHPSSVPPAAHQISV